MRIKDAGNAGADLIEKPMAIKKSYIFSIGFFLFFVYALPLQWTNIDKQAFARMGLAETYSGDIISRQIGPPLLFLFLLVFIVQLPKAAAILPKGFYLAVVLPFLSVFWTIEPARTINALIVLSLTAIFCALAVRLFGLSDILSRFWKLSVAVLLISAALGAIGDDHVMMFLTHEGAWRGLFNHKNVFGPFVALIFLITVLGNEYIKQTRLVRITVVGLCLLCFYMASSSTAVISTLAAVFISLLANIRIRSRTLRVMVYMAGVLATVVCAVLAFSYLDTLAEVAGRDLTLTGRTNLWQAALPFTYDAPLGYGFATGGGEQVIEAMRILSGWAIAASTHNAYISRALDVGWFGVALMLVWVVPMMFVIDTSKMKSAKMLLAAVATLHLVGGIAEATGLLYTNAAFLLILIISSGIRMKDAAPLLQADSAQAESAIDRDIMEPEHSYS